MKKAKLLIGTSGYNYPDWKDRFYPKDLPQNKWLEHYQNYFDTVELNVTFYRLPNKKAFKSWAIRTKKNFIFSIKGSRYITHIKRLKDPKKHLKIFFDQIKPLKSKIKVILWQLPPNLKHDQIKLKAFLKELKKYTGYKNAFEFRHESWLNEGTFDLLKKNKATLVQADWPRFKQKLSDDFAFIYVRRHGPHLGSPYSGSYSTKTLKQDAKQIKKWLKKGKYIYFFFNNDILCYAIKNALTLKKMTK